MNQAPKKARQLAEHLLRLEAGADKRGVGKGTAVARACEELRRPLTVFMGSAGFHALLGRALTLAQAESPGLRQVQLGPDGSLEGLGEVEPGRGQIAKDEVPLVAHLIGLLILFVGEALTLRLVQEAWPTAAVDDFGSDEGDKI